MKRSYYAIIPANVRYDKRLTPNAKLLYGEITALCNEKGYCWASNSYFAKLYEVSNKSISTWVNQLAELGYITTKLIYAEGSKEVKERRICLSTTPIEENFHTPRKKVLDPIEENFHTPMEEKVKDNTTVINNTINKEEEERKKLQFREIVGAYEQNGFGTLSSVSSGMIIDLVETYSSEWVLDAMKESVKYNARNLKYVESILKGWKAKGKGVDTRGKRNAGVSKQSGKNEDTDWAKRAGVDSF